MSETGTKGEQAPKQKVSASEELAALELEIKRKELEKVNLELEEKKANLQDLRERLDERAIKRHDKRQTSITNGVTLQQTAQNDKMVQTRCNHRKGGLGRDGVVGGQGNDSQYAVLKHTFLNGDTWVRCLRCGKTWKPPVEENYYFDAAGIHVPPGSDDRGRLLKPAGTLNQEQYLAAVVQYQTALNFETLNKPSSSYMFSFSDGGKIFRHVTNSATLR